MLNNYPKSEGMSGSPNQEDKVQKEVPRKMFFNYSPQKMQKVWHMTGAFFYRNQENWWDSN